MVKLCKDEDQALRELDRMAMSVMARNGSMSGVRRGGHGIWIEVTTHGADDGKELATHYISVEKARKSTA